VQVVTCSKKKVARHSDVTGAEMTEQKSPFHRGTSGGWDICSDVCSLCFGVER
jgi:hypothetical protein